MASTRLSAPSAPADAPAQAGTPAPAGIPGTGGPPQASPRAGLRSLLLDVAVPLALPVAVVWLNTALALASIGAGVVGGSFFSFPMEKLVRAEAQTRGEAG